MTNPNYSTYLGTATQLQRWRDFIAHAAAYLCFNIVFIVVWSVTGNGPFWPAFPLVGWGIGLTFQHHANTWRGPVTDDDVTRRMRQHHKMIGASALNDAGPLRSGTGVRRCCRVSVPRDGRGVRGCQ
jgi:hypothetical protein